MDAIRMMGIVKCFGPVRANDEHPVRPLSPGCRRDLY